MSLLPLRDLKLYDWAAKHNGTGEDKPLIVDAGQIAARKSLVIDKGPIDEDKRTVEATISTGFIDRDGDWIDQEGWDLERFKANPVVLWSHDREALPIAKAVDIGVVGKGNRARLKSTAEFELHPFADAVFNLVKNGTINATSVGFIPRAWNFVDEENRSTFSIDIYKAELLEWSFVPVPANPEALVGAKGLSGENRKAIAEWIDQCFEEGRDIGIPKEDLRKMWSALHDNPTYYQMPLETSLALAEANIQKAREQAGLTAKLPPVVINTTSTNTVELKSDTPAPILEDKPKDTKAESRRARHLLSSYRLKTLPLDNATIH